LGESKHEEEAVVRVVFDAVLLVALTVLGVEKRTAFTAFRLREGTTGREGRADNERGLIRVVTALCDDEREAVQVEVVEVVEVEVVLQGNGGTAAIVTEVGT